jgi:hypothetical protein
MGEDQRKGWPVPHRPSVRGDGADLIFTRVTGFAKLDEAVARTHANKDKLLRVLDRPEIPLHTNGSENAVRSFVTKRRISGETGSAAGKQARDTFHSWLPAPSSPFRSGSTSVPG